MGKIHAEDLDIIPSADGSSDYGIDRKGRGFMIRPPDLGTYNLMMGLRQALIIALGHIEDYLEMKRSIVPRRKRG